MPKKRKNDWRNLEQRGRQSDLEHWRRSDGKFSSSYPDANIPGTVRGGGYDNYAYETSPSSNNNRDDQVLPVPVAYGPNQNIEDEEAPIHKRRRCRDVICTGLFGASIILMIIIFAYTVSNGSIIRLIHMTDSTNCDTCGIKNNPAPNITNSGQDNTNLPYAVILNNKTFDTSFHYLLPNSFGQYTTKCRASCPPDLKPIANRCVPKKLTFKVSIESSSGTLQDISGFANEVASDFEKSWADVIWMCAIALGLSILMTILLRLFAGFIIWIVLIVVSISALAISILAWYFWLKNKDVENGSWSQSELNLLFIGAIVFSIFTVLLLFVICFMMKRIALVIKLFNEAGKAIHAMPLLLFQPLITFGALLISFSLCVVIFLLIESSGEKDMISSTLSGGGEDICIYKKNSFLQFSRWWNIFMIIWITQFVVDCQHMVIAGSVSIWFFTRNKRRLGFPILLSIRRLICYHLGSIAFGSLIITILKVIRYILEVIKKRFARDNSFCRGVICVCQCCLGCLEKFLKFLNRNAYIEIAIHGYGFCKSAQKAFKVLVNNALRVAAINSIGDFVLFLAKVAIVASTLTIGFYLLKGKENLNHRWSLLLIPGIISYFIAHCFISVYEMAIDTVFICFCEDYEMNDGISKPFYMSKGLMEFVEISKKEMKRKNKHTNKPNEVGEVQRS